MNDTTSASERIKRGVAALASLMNHWLASSSHDKLAAILRWAYGGPTGLDGGALSRIRNGKQARGAGLKHLDAMAEANRAIWTWHAVGPEAAIREFGPLSSWDVRAEWLDEINWLPSPTDPTQPMGLGDLAMLLMGRIELEYLGDPLLSPGKLTRMSERLPDLLEDLGHDQGWRHREALAKFGEAYPSKDPARHRKLRNIMNGDAYLTGAELELEIPALAEMVRSIRGLEVFTSAELKAELLSADRGA